MATSFAPSPRNPRPQLVAVVEFLELTEGDRLRHSKFVAFREDKNPREVWFKEQAAE